MTQRRRQGTSSRFQDGHLWSTVTLFTLLMVCMCGGSRAFSSARNLRHSEQETLFRDRRSVPSSVAQWSQWYNNDRPWNGQGDFETTDKIQQQQSICPTGQQVARTQCRVAGSTDTFDMYTYNRSQADILLQACTVYGLICLNNQQPDGRSCQDYELRFLCTDVSNDGVSTGSFFLNFDLKIYIILVSVPLLVFLLRILWSCVRRNQRKRQLQRLERSLSDSTMSSIDNENEAGTSSLASPPPAYSDLFGHGLPQVFAISDGTLRGCTACKHCGVSSGAREILSLAPGAEDERRRVSSPDSGVAIPDAGAVEARASASHQREENSVQLSTSRDATSGEEITSSPATSDLSGENSSEANAQTGVVSQPDSAAAGRDRSELELRSGHSFCACQCHALQFVVAAGQDNPAFDGDCGYNCEPKLGPGMHKPVLPFIRVNTATSFLSITESLPDYEQALEILNAEHTGSSACNGEVAHDLGIPRPDNCRN